MIFIFKLRDQTESKPEINGKKILEAPIHIGELAKKEGALSNEQNSIWIKSNVEDTTLVRPMYYHNIDCM